MKDISDVIEDEGYDVGIRGKELSLLLKVYTKFQHVLIEKQRNVVFSGSC